MEIKTMIILGLITAITIFAIMMWICAKATERENKGCHHTQIQKNIDQRFNKEDHR